MLLFVKHLTSFVLFSEFGVAPQEILFFKNLPSYVSGNWKRITCFRENQLSIAVLSFKGTKQIWIWTFSRGFLSHMHNTAGESLRHVHNSHKSLQDPGEGCRQRQDITYWYCYRYVFIYSISIPVSVTTDPLIFVNVLYMSGSTVPCADVFFWWSLVC